ncbi:ribonuclease HI [Breznakibacter xylanolyticus]|uniref:Ribonuclease H n=1 Tax=Breznakibacter xylanolyticus TaxID=990 RepID=A0A2W7MTU5_9BACT|nr:ribonuclease H family protein [Breznakibacter xylanolyticus]MBN2744298.1 ribonuclease H family protein [Marinilabiliaceae bacterium]PZX11230.1 ribonuclease HI [Breznakibacter xylanolyticus]
MAKKNFYVVWIGLKPGIYRTWDECKAMTQGFPNAKYMGFATLVEAQNALANGAPNADTKQNPPHPSLQNKTGNYIIDSLAVDAACSGNPGVMEYRGVHIASGQVWFHQKYELGTNNIGEFLAIVHGLAELKKRNLNIPLYTDSETALSWLRRKRCNSKLEINQQTTALFQIIQRAEYWLANNTWTQQVLKWDTENWGEIPADFGRK